MLWEEQVWEREISRSANGHPSTEIEWTMGCMNLEFRITTFGSL